MKKGDFLYLIPNNHRPLQIHPFCVKTRHACSHNAGWGCMLWKWTFTVSPEMPEGLGWGAGVWEDVEQVEILFL